MSPQLQQLLFGSVDLMIDGRESSGWQVIARSEGLDKEATDEIVRLIEPELSPLCPLPGFPTQEEVNAADRRLVHRTIGTASVLLHTAPAGQDTTGRPNSMTHVVVDHSDTTTRPLLGADTWRAGWWSTPFGPEQMRAARLPAPMAPKPGTVVTADAALELVLRPGAASVLGVLADVVASNAESSDPDRRQVAVLLVESVDDAAQWIGALLGATASEPARSVNWSTLERVHGERDLERLRSSGLDIAAVPLSDLTDEVRIPERCVIVDPRRPPQDHPSTSFGRFIAAMAADPGLWITAHESIKNKVLSQLIDHTGVTFAWPAAMAQAMSWIPSGDEDAELFGLSSNSDLRADVESALLQAAVPALEDPHPGTADALREARERLVDEVDQRGPVEWRKLCQRIGDHVPEDRAGMLGRRYLEAAGQDPGWLLHERAAAPPLPEPVRAALQRWSEQEGSAADVSSLVDTAIATIDSHLAAGPERRTSLEHSIARGFLASNFLEDGLILGSEKLAALLAPLAEDVLAPHPHSSETFIEHREVVELISRLPERGRQELARKLEQRLSMIVSGTAGTGESVPQPVLAVPMAIALGPTLRAPERPWVTLQIGLAGIVTGVESATVVLSAISELTRPPADFSAKLSFAREPAQAIENGIRPEDLPVLEQLAASGLTEAGRWMLIASLRNPEHDESRTHLSERRRGAPSISAVKRETVTPTSWDECATLLGEAVCQPFLSGTMTLETAWTWAENTRAAAAQLRGGLPSIEQEPVVGPMLNDLMRTAELRASAALIVLSVGSPQLARQGIRHALDLADVFSEASQNPWRFGVPYSTSWGEAYIEALHALAADETVASEATALPRPAVGADVRDPSWQGGGLVGSGLPSAAAGTRPEMPGAPERPELRTAAAAMLEARLRGASEDAASVLVAEAKSSFRGDLQGWARARQIVPLLEERRSSRVDRLGDIVKKNLSMLPWQKKEGRDG